MEEPAIQKTPEELEELIVCPQCDAAYRLTRPKHGEQAVCQRCHTVLITPRRKAGAQIISVPAAFTRPTGRAHWEVLLRARAIETGNVPLECWDEDSINRWKRNGTGRSQSEPNR